MKNYFYLILAVFLFNISTNCTPKDTVVVAFWNLENLYDIFDDPVKSDSDFLPQGSMKWTLERLDKKLTDLARVIRSMNNGNGPDILGVSEVENQAVLDTLVRRHFSDKNYKIAYAESPDERGIDNGLIYDADLFSLKSVKTDTVILPDKNPTRLVLKADLVTKNMEILHVFVNHWPSRRGGENESQINRITAAQVLRKHVNNIFKDDKNSKIIIIGDFNDEPGNISLKDTLAAYPLRCNESLRIMSALYNTGYEIFERNEGSLKFQDTWNLLDQVILSEGVLAGKGFRYICGSFEVYRPEFMITKSGKFQGTPHPTYGGKRYLGGYSDHFPVIAKFLMDNKKTARNKK